MDLVLLTYDAERRGVCGWMNRPKKKEKEKKIRVIQPQGLSLLFYFCLWSLLLSLSPEGWLKDKLEHARNCKPERELLGGVWKFKKR